MKLSSAFLGVNSKAKVRDSCSVPLSLRAAPSAVADLRRLSPRPGHHLGLAAASAPHLPKPKPPKHPTHHLQMSGRPSFSQLAQKFVQQRAAAAGRAGGGRSSGPSGGQPGGGPSFGQALGGVGGTVLLVGGGLLVNSALFNGKSTGVGVGVAGMGRRAEADQDGMGWVGAVQLMEDTVLSSTPG